LETFIKPEASRLRHIPVSISELAVAVSRLAAPVYMRPA